MSLLNYPSEKKYELPKHNVLVLGCMDLRLTDNLLDFLNFDNLQNRYDHVILAGTSLLCTQKNKNLLKKDPATSYANWRQVFYDHLSVAKTLHGIEDVYIVEHQDCGAYKNFLDPKKVDMSTLALEKKWHKTFSVELADDIQKAYPKLNVHCFFIDMRGNVELLHTKSVH
jgi:carbonic anhydrase